MSPFVGAATKIIEKNIEHDDKPSDQEIAENLIDSLKLRDDKIFIRQCLIGVYGSKRLSIINSYLEQWELGSDTETNVIKKDNAGRYRANTWLRARNEPNTK